jgi:hypothetical protein
LAFVRRHDQRGAVGTVGLQVVAVQVTGLGEGGPQADRIVTGRIDQPISTGGTVDRVISHLGEEEHGQEVGHIEALAHVALAFARAHANDVSADLLGASAEFLQGRARPFGPLGSHLILPLDGEQITCSRRV